MVYEIEKILLEMEKENDNSYMEILAIEKEIKMLEKACKCMKIIVNSSKTTVKAEILAIIG